MSDMTAQLTAHLQVALSTDPIGRIINRLVLPKCNAALRSLAEGLAREADMDLTCKLGLGYSDGPIECVLRSGLSGLDGRSDNPAAWSFACEQPRRTHAGA